MNLIRIILIGLALSACQSAYFCPEPDLVKLRKTPAKRMKYYQHQMNERAMARARAMEVKHMLKSNEHEVKKKVDIEEWDCPRPGSAHDRLIQKQRKKIEAISEQNLKKKNEKEGVESLTEVDKLD